jgi:hypothetical protein
MTTLMTTSRTALGGALLALALLPAFWPGAAAAHGCDDPFSTDLIAGRTIDAGAVKVCNDDTTLTITYEATFPWCLLETHLHVATIPDPPADPDGNIPQNRPGNPIPGHFAYGDDYGGCLDGPATFVISLDQIDGGVGPGDSVAIAAQAEVEDGARAEGAWGEGARFVARGNWAMYFTYTVQEGACGGAESCAVFVTSTTHTGNLGGLTGADEICQDRAEAPGSLAAPGTYQAWLSTSAASAAARLTHATVPYRLVDGTTIAANWADLTDGDLNAPLGLTEQGGAPPSAFVWTGTFANGLATDVDCEGWTTDARLTNGAMGNPSLSNRWSAEGTAACFLSLPLYCFQQ